MTESIRLEAIQRWWQCWCQRLCSVYSPCAEASKPGGMTHFVGTNINDKSVTRGSKNTGIHNSNDQKSQNTVTCIAHKWLKDAATGCVLRPIGLDVSKCVLRPVLRPGPRWGSLQRSLGLPSWIWGRRNSVGGGNGYRRERERKRREWRGGKGREKEMGMEFRGKVWVIGFRGDPGGEWRHGARRPPIFNQIVSILHRRGNDFSVGGSKIGEKSIRQSNSKYNFMQRNRPTYFSKNVGPFSRIFVLKLGYF